MGAGSHACGCRRYCPARGAPAPWPGGAHGTATGCQHAASVAPSLSSSGCSSEQRPLARGQRGWNAQPDGIAVKRGIVPSICASRARPSTIDGIGSHQSNGVRMARAVDDVRHRTDLDDPPGVHDGDAIGGFGDDAHVVRDEHDGCAVLAGQVASAAG